MADHQPTGMTSANGYICSVGLYVNAEQCTLVFPMCSDDPIDKDESAARLNEAVRTTIFGPLADCLVTTAWISFVSSEGMVDGLVPDRLDFAPIDYPGNAGTPDAPPSSNGALIFFYEDSGDVVGTERIRIGKNFIPGIPTSEVSGNQISDALQALMLTLAQVLRNGIDDSEGHKWYRVLAAPKNRTAGQPIRRVFVCGPRGYIVTQKRRLLPRQ